MAGSDKVIYKLPSSIAHCCFDTGRKLDDQSSTLSKRRRFNNDEGGTVSESEMLYIASNAGWLYAIRIPNNILQETSKVEKTQKDRVESSSAARCPCEVISVGDENKIINSAGVQAMVSCDRKLAVLRRDCNLLLTVYATEEAGTYGNVSLSPLINVTLDNQFSKRLSYELHVFHLHVIVPKTYSKSYTDSGGDVICISDLLFNRLFGSEVNLLNSPILLLSGYNGLIYWIPQCGAFGCNFRILCSHDDVVVEVISLPAEENGSSHALGFIGRSGSVLLASAVSSSPFPVYVRRQIYGPVVCCAHFRAGLVLHSTADDLYVTDMGVGKDDAYVSSVKPTGLRIRDVAAIFVHRSSGSTAVSSVLVVTYGGRASVFELASKDSSGAAIVDRRWSLSNAGRLQNIMGDLLNSIGRLSDNLSTVNSTSQIYDKILEQLAFAGMLKRYVSAQFAAAGSFPVQCVIDSVVDELGSSCRCGISANLINNSSFVFDAGWSAVVTVCRSKAAVEEAACDDASCRVETDLAAGRHHQCVSRNLAGFSRGISETIVLNLNADGPLLNGVPIAVTAMLIYAPQVSRTDDVEDAIVIRLCERTVDVLDFLRPVTNSKCRQPATTCFGQNCRSLVTVCRPHYGRGLADACSSDVLKLLAEFSVPSQTSEHHTVCARLPMYALRLCNQDTSSPSHVIKWLFHGNPLFRAAAVSFESGVTLVSATGHEVTINVSPAGSDEYRLSLRGSNVILLTAVHLAILTKVKQRSERVLYALTKSQTSRQELTEQLERRRRRARYVTAGLPQFRRTAMLEQHSRATAPTGSGTAPHAMNPLMQQIEDLRLKLSSSSDCSSWQRVLETFETMRNGENT